MTERHQLLGQPVHDPLGPAIELWWNGLGEWRDLRNPHDRLLHGCQPNKSQTAKTFRDLFLRNAGTYSELCRRLSISRTSGAPQYAATSSDQQPGRPFVNSASSSIHG